MSNPGVWSGYNLPIIIVALGLLFAFFVDLLFFIAFIAVLGYYLYKIEKRLSELERAKAHSSEPKAKQG